MPFMCQSFQIKKKKKRFLKLANGVIFSKYVQSNPDRFSQAQEKDGNQNGYSMQKVNPLLVKLSDGKENYYIDLAKDHHIFRQKYFCGQRPQTYSMKGQIKRPPCLLEGLQSVTLQPYDAFPTYLKLQHFCNPRNILKSY